MPKLTLIRGLPGSGKSTMAKSMEGFIHLEADFYHLDYSGEYVFDVRNLRASHEWCQLTTRIMLRAGHDVVVANTFTRHHEIQPYEVIAADTESELTIIEAKGNFGSVHDVPEEQLKRMADRWEEI